VVAQGHRGAAVAGEGHGVAQADALAAGDGEEAGAQAVAAKLPRRSRRAAISGSALSPLQRPAAGATHGRRKKS
jgi:hypothetical protein